MSRTRGRARCDEVRELLPEYAEPGPRPAGPVEVHLAACAACRAELDSYRSLLISLEAIREQEVPVPDGYLERSLQLARPASMPGAVTSLADFRAVTSRVGYAIRRHGPGARYALATIGGAAAGATAIAIVWWSLARRAVPGAGSL